MTLDDLKLMVNISKLTILGCTEETKEELITKDDWFDTGLLGICPYVTDEDNSEWMRVLKHDCEQKPQFVLGNNLHRFFSNFANLILTLTKTKEENIFEIKPVKVRWDDYEKFLTRTYAIQNPFVLDLRGSVND